MEPEGRRLGGSSGRMMEASPERGRPVYASGRPAPARPMRKVQIVYYLCRNGQLEHPHFMELAQHPHQPLRLKDVTDRLTLLRGKGMPALFSWSCKRNYKNGYVWNDLSENDVIYPSDGVEYVLKGSEIFPGCSSSAAAAAAAHLRVTDRSPTKALLSLPHAHKQCVDGYRDDTNEEDPDDDELAYAYHHRRAAAARLAGRQEKPGVVVSARVNRSRPVELPVEETSPPSSTSSDNKPPPQQQQQQPLDVRADHSNQIVQQQVDPEPIRTGSMLLQLIACGSSSTPAPVTGGNNNRCRAEPRRSCGLVSRLSSRAGGGSADEEDDDDGYDDDNEMPPAGRRFGRRLAVEDKEYFSGSIVEGGGGRGTPLPASSLKRSNSYNEERLGVGSMGEERRDEAMDADEGIIRGRCIPGRKKQPHHK